MPTPRTLLITNDFPPKVGGIQVNHEQLFPQLDVERLWVLASFHPEAARYDSQVPFHVERIRSSTMLPLPSVARRVDRMIRKVEPDVVVFGSALPLGLLGSVARRHGLPYVVMVYGADVPVPARIPGAAQMLRNVLTNAAGIIAFGAWVEQCARQACLPQSMPPTLVLVPGVDTNEFTPGDKLQARKALGVALDRPTVTSVSRLVARKGMHHLVATAALLRRDIGDLQVVIAGSGRQESRLNSLVRKLDLGDTVKLIGRVSDADLVYLYRAADVFTMLCHNRWFGVEQEGFGLVFVEASACGVPVVAGRSGGSVDAVQDTLTGTVVNATDHRAVARALRSYLVEPLKAQQVGAAGRQHVQAHFQWSQQAKQFVDWFSLRFGPEGIGGK